MPHVVSEDFFGGDGGAGPSADDDVGSGVPLLRTRNKGHPASAHPEGGARKIASWPRASVIICANLMGAGVLALPTVMRHLGWIPGLAIVAVLGLGSVYSGALLTRVWILAEEKAHGRPAAKYGDLGRAAYGALGHDVVNFVCYFYISCVTVVFHLTTAESLQTIFHATAGDWCQWQFSAIVAFLVWPFAQVRSLQNVSSLAIVGALTILGTVAIVVGRLAAMGALEDARWHLVDISSRDAPQKVGAVMTVVFSYCGQAIFTELITAMERPRDFPKAVWSSSLTMMLTYAVIAAAGYAALGSLAVAPVTSALPNDVWVLMANVLLFVHVLVAYVIEVNILSKGLINLLARPGGGRRESAAGEDAGNSGLGVRGSIPAGATALPKAGPGTPHAIAAAAIARERRSRRVWMASTSFLIAGAFLLSNVCSFFVELLSFAGATGGIATTYIFPCVFLLRLDKRMPRWERFVCRAVVGFAVLLAALGIVNACLDIWRQWEQIGPPFACMSCEYKRAHKLTPGVC